MSSSYVLFVFLTFSSPTTGLQMGKLSTCENKERINK